MGSRHDRSRHLGTHPPPRLVRRPPFHKGARRPQGGSGFRRTGRKGRPSATRPLRRSGRRARRGRRGPTAVRRGARPRAKAAPTASRRRAAALGPRGETGTAASCGSISEPSSRSTAGDANGMSAATAATCGCVARSSPATIPPSGPESGSASATCGRPSHAIRSPVARGHDHLVARLAEQARDAGGKGLALEQEVRRVLSRPMRRLPPPARSTPLRRGASATSRPPFPPPAARRPEATTIHALAPASDPSDPAPCGPKRADRRLVALTVQPGAHQVQPAGPLRERLGQPGPDDLANRDSPQHRRQRGPHEQFEGDQCRHGIPREREHRRVADPREPERLARDGRRPGAPVHRGRPGPCARSRVGRPTRRPR